MKTLKRTWADISLDNLEYNYRSIRAHLPQGTKFLGVMKADAYGHGAVPVSRALADLGAEYLAVSNLEEAVQIRRGEVRLPILILGYIDDRAGLGFATVECGTDILSALRRMDPGGAVLLDSVTALLSNEMFRADGTLDADAPERLERELLAFSRQMRCCVFVSDYIYADGGQYDAWTEAYRRGLARLDRALAAACENAAELCCAQTYWYKGGFDR